MKRKAVCFVLFLLATAVFMLGCGGGGGSSNPAASNLIGNSKVTGVVNDVKGNPVANASVKMILASKAISNNLVSNKVSSLRMAVSNVETEFNGVTDSYGKYTFNNVPMGVYTLSAVTADGAQIITKLDVRASEVEAPKVVLKPTGTVSGSVTFNNKSVPAAIVYIDGSSYCAMTDQDGNYSLEGVPVATEFNLCVSSSEGAADSIKINLNAEKRTLVQNFALTVKENKNVCILTVNTESTDFDSSKIIIYAVSNDGECYVAQVKENKAVLKLATAGAYKVFPGYFGNEFSLTNVTISDLSVSEGDIKNNKQLSLNINLAGTAVGGFATVTGHINDADLSYYEVALFDDKGNAYKKNIMGDNDFSIRLPFNGSDQNQKLTKYTLIAASDKKISIKTGINLVDGENNLGTINPVAAIPNVAVNNSGSINVEFVDSIITSNSNSVNTESNVFVKFFAYCDDNEPKVFLKNLDQNEYLSLLPNSKYELTTKELNLSDYRLGVEFYLYNSRKQYSFIKSCSDSSSKTFSPSFKSVTLNGLNMSENIIAFKAFKSDEDLYYYVATAKEFLVFDANGNKKNSKTFPEDIKLGNACFAESGGLLSLYTQYIDNDSSLCIDCYSYRDATITNVNKKWDFDTIRDNLPSFSPETINAINSAIKLTVQEKDNKTFCYSICDNIIICLDDTNSLIGTCMLNAFNTDQNEPKELENKFLVASYSSLLMDSKSNRWFYYYLAIENNNSYLIKGIFDPPSTQNEYASCEFKNSALIGNKNFSEDRFINMTKNAAVGSSNYIYRCFGLKSKTDYPYSLKDCLDNADAVTKVFINDNSTSSDGEKTEFVVTDSIYPGSSDISSSFINCSFGNDGVIGSADILRSNDEQCLRIKRLNSSVREQKINLRQVLNSEGYLEGSIVQVSDNIHVICSEGTDVKVMVVGL